MVLVLGQNNQQLKPIESSNNIYSNRVTLRKSKLTIRLFLTGSVEKWTTLEREHRYCMNEHEITKKKELWAI